MNANLCIQLLIAIVTALITGAGSFLLKNVKMKLIHLEQIINMK